MDELPPGQHAISTIPIKYTGGRSNKDASTKAIDGNRVIPTEESGEPKLLKEHSYITQGGLERSNVNYIGNINEVLRLNSSMIAGTRLIKVIDDMYQRSINLTQ